MSRQHRRSRTRVSRLLAVAGLASLGLLSPQDRAADAAQLSAGGATLDVPVLSMQERRLTGLWLQRYDYSCGSAALATLLTFHYDRPTMEDEVFTRMYEVGDQAQIHEKGFSLLDMKRYLASRGLQAEGYRVGIGDLREAGVPLIALIDLNGYKHFVVVKGIRDRHVLVGDPSYGLRTFPVDAFEAMWNGIAFVIVEDLEIAKASFNQKADWAIKPRAPIGRARDNQSVSSFTRNLLGPFEF